MVKEDEMKWLTQLTLVACLCCIPLTASWADMEEEIAVLSGEAGEGFGHQVDNVGDVNGDGCDDLVVGCSEHILPKHAYLFLCGTAFDSIPDVTFTSTTSTGFGAVLSSAGDVNGDGYNDVMLYAHPGLKEIVCMYYGGNPMDSVVDVILTGRPDQKEFFGQTMSDAGDLNKDGYDDVIVGAYEAPNGGKAYVFFGGNPMDSIPDLILKTDSGRAFGLGVGGLGDINGDGYSDIGVSDPWKYGADGEVYIYLGGPNMDRIPECIIRGESASSAHFGYHMTGGDLDNDGFSDPVIGGHSYVQNGKFYIFRGSEDFQTNPEVSLSLYGRYPWEEFGRDLEVVGDLNKDGYNDVVTGTSWTDHRVYVVYGGGKQMDRQIDLTIPGSQHKPDFFGYRTTGIDIDSNGHRDLCLGSPRDDKVFIYRVRYNLFSITLKPDSRKVVKGISATDVGFTATITNNTKEDQNLHFWIELLGPNAHLYQNDPIVGPKQKKIPAGKTVVKHLWVEIPGDPGLGRYTCTLNADTTEPKFPYVDFIENGSFEFELVGSPY
jgi:hypothetical protein